MSKSQISKGNSFSRTRAVFNNKELLFYTAWQKYCKVHKSFPKHFASDNNLTRREAKCIATLIQWLGTNVGFNFLEGMLKTAGYQINKIPKKEKDLPINIPYEWVNLLKCFEANDGIYLSTQAITNSLNKRIHYTNIEVRKILNTLEEYECVTHVTCDTKNIWAITTKGGAVRNGAYTNNIEPKCHLLDI